MQSYITFRFDHLYNPNLKPVGMNSVRYSLSRTEKQLFKETQTLTFAAGRLQTKLKKLKPQLLHEL